MGYDGKEIKGFAPLFFQLIFKGLLMNTKKHSEMDLYRFLITSNKYDKRKNNSFRWTRDIRASSPEEGRRILLSEAHPFGVKSIELIEV